MPDLFALMTADPRFNPREPVTVNGFRYVPAVSACVNHPVRDVLDGDPLCQACCDAWVRGERE
ncbi:MAG: hypothetical protein KGM49_09425 [Sphingomonadales bacterium]|nr:hypothetical protein [Sphingomonadales bacterium]